MDRCPVQGNRYLATQKYLAHVSPYFCSGCLGCLGFAVGVWGSRGCPGPRCRVLPLWETSVLSLICCQQAQSASQSQPLCCVSWHCSLEVNLVHAVHYQAQQSQMSSHWSEVAAEVWFCSPLSPFLLSFNLPLSFFLCVVPCAPSFSCLLSACLPFSLIPFSPSPL